MGMSIFISGKVNIREEQITRGRDLNDKRVNSLRRRNNHHNCIYTKESSKLCKSKTDKTGGREG